MNHYTISESDRQELIAALESTGRHNCLAYGVKSLQPVAQAAQPAQSTAAIKTLEHLGYTYYGAEYWKPPLGKRPRFLDQAAQPAQNHVWIVHNKVASMYFWSEDVARKAATFAGSLCMDVARIDLLDFPAAPSTKEGS